MRLNELGACVLGLAETYQPLPEAAPARTLKVLPNLDVVATGEPSPADHLILAGYAQRTGDRVWTLSRPSLLASVAAGRSVAELREFLVRRAAQPELPGVLLTLLDDVTDRAGRLRELGRVSLIECADPPLAALISHDRRLRPLCTALGERHLAVAEGDEERFRRALLAVGYVLAGQ